MNRPASGPSVTGHWFLDHPGEADPPKFRFRVIGSFKDAMSRQVKEAIRIQNRPGSLNSKGEFGGGGITRLVVEKSLHEQKKEDIGRRRKQDEEDMLWESFLVKKQELAGKRRTAGDGEAPAPKRAKTMDVEDLLPEGGRLDTFQYDDLPEGWNTIFMPELSEENEIENDKSSSPEHAVKPHKARGAGLPIVDRQKVTGVTVMGSKKVGGAPIMSVKDIAEYFRSIQNKGKGKAKPKFKKKICSKGEQAANLDSDYSKSDGPNPGRD